MMIMFNSVFFLLFIIVLYRGMRRALRLLVCLPGLLFLSHSLSFL